MLFKWQKRRTNWLKIEKDFATVSHLTVKKPNSFEGSLSLYGTGCITDFAKGKVALGKRNLCRLEGPTKFRENSFSLVEANSLFLNGLLIFYDEGPSEPVGARKGPFHLLNCSWLTDNNHIS